MEESSPTKVLNNKSIFRNGLFEIVKNCKDLLNKRFDEKISKACQWWFQKTKSIIAFKLVDRYLVHFQVYERSRNAFRIFHNVLNYKSSFNILYV